MPHRTMPLAVAAVFGAASACLDRPAEQPQDAGAAAAAGMNGSAAADTEGESGLDVRLDRLAEPRPVRLESSRNPFRFGGGRPENAAAGRPAAAPREAPGAEPRRGPRPALRFIGVVDAPESAGAIAVLTDGADVFQGRVGDTVDGRYRIIRIADDAVDVELLVAGGGRTLQLDGAPGFKER